MWYIVFYLILLWNKLFPLHSQNSYAGTLAPNVVAFRMALWEVIGSSEILEWTPYDGATVLVRGETVSMLSLPQCVATWKGALTRNSWLSELHLQSSDL